NDSAYWPSFAPTSSTNAIRPSRISRSRFSLTPGSSRRPQHVVDCPRLEREPPTGVVLADSLPGRRPRRGQETLVGQRAAWIDDDGRIARALRCQRTENQPAERRLVVGLVGERERRRPLVREPEDPVLSRKPGVSCARLFVDQRDQLDGRRELEGCGLRRLHHPR